MLRRLLFWRWNFSRKWYHNITYDNCLLLVMVITGVILWQSDPENSIAIRDINTFSGNPLSYEVIAALMIIAGTVGLFRAWLPHELLALYLPYFYFVWIIAAMTLVAPGPARPPARLWTWLFPVVLTTGYQVEKIIRGYLD